jgi:putative spermidine/putrescine transport system permease protein
MSVYRPDPQELWVPAFTLDNYARLLGEPLYARVLARTVGFALVTTAICAVLGYPLAYFIARTRSRLRGVYILMVFFPLLVSVIIRSYGWLALLGDQGAINSVWIRLPWTTGPLPLLFHGYSVVIGLVQVLLPFMVVPLMSAIQNIDTAQEEAATSLGGGPLLIFRAIILPLSAPGLISGSLLVFAGGMSAFAIPMFLGGPRQASMAVLIYQEMVFTFNWPIGSALSVLMLVTTLVAIVASLLAARRFVPRGLRM